MVYCVLSHMNKYSRARTIKEVAEQLNISSQMVYKLIRRGELDAFKIGNAVRILQSDVDTYIQRQKQLYRMESMNERADERQQLHPLILEEVSVRKDKFVLGPISLDVPPHAVVGIAGGSGSGKTSLLRSINGLDRLESGRVKLGPVDLTEMTVEARRIGFVFQDSVLLPRMNVEENLTFPLRIKKVTEPTRSQRLNEVVDELDIERKYLEKYEEQLPAGIRQLTAIGKERMHMLDLLLMDEPMRHLDAHLRSEIRSLVRSVVRTLGKTTLLALNEPEDIMAICDYVIVLKAGQLVEYGPVQQVYSYPQDIASLEALSHLGVNTIPVELRAGRTIPFDLAAEDYNDGRYRLCFRPQDIRVGQPGDIQVEEQRRSVFDGSRDLATVRLSALQPGANSLQEEAAASADIVIPRNTSQINFIKLEHWYLFKTD